MSEATKNELIARLRMLAVDLPLVFDDGSLLDVDDVAVALNEAADALAAPAQGEASEGGVIKSPGWPCGCAMTVSELPSGSNVPGHADCAAVRQVSESDHSTERVEEMHELTMKLLETRAERDAATAAIERVRAVADSLGGRYADNSDAAYLTNQIRAALDGAPEPEAVEWARLWNLGVDEDV